MKHSDNHSQHNSHEKSTEHSNHDSMVMAESNSKEYLKFLGVILCIATLSFSFYTVSFFDDLSELIRLFMGVFMITFASFKFAGYKMFAEMFAMYDIVAKKYLVYGKVFPFIQLGLGFIYLFDFLPIYRDYFTIVFAGIAAIGVFKEVFINKSKIKCACLGNVIKLPLSTVSFVEDFGMALMAIFMLAL